MHKYFWDRWRAFEKRGEFVNTEQKKILKKYTYIYTRFQKHCNLKNIYTYIYTFCFHIYSFVFAL